VALATWPLDTSKQLLLTTEPPCQQSPKPGKRASLQKVELVFTVEGRCNFAAFSKKDPALTYLTSAWFKQGPEGLCAGDGRGQRMHRQGA